MNVTEANKINVNKIIRWFHFIERFLSEALGATHQFFVIKYEKLSESQPKRKKFVGMDRNELSTYKFILTF